MVVAVWTLGVFGASAQAKLVHPFLSSFGSFASVQGVAVESGSGTVYVYDGGAGLVYKFDASGNPVNFASTGTNAISTGFAFSDEGEIAVDSSSGPAKGDIYVAHADGTVEIFGATGEKLGELTEQAGDPWGEACGVAVDSSGAVYVGLYSSHVNKYVPSANPVTNADYVSSLEGLNGVCNVAADSAGDVYSDTWSEGPVTRYEPSQFGALTASGSVVDEAGSTLAVDPANDELYIDQKDSIAQYGPHGEPFLTPVTKFGSSGPGAINGSLGIAVSGYNDEIYASNGEGAVNVFGPGEVVQLPPVIEEQYASDVTGTSATLGAKLNPEESTTTYRFEYGPTPAYGSSTPETEAGSGQSGVTVLAHLQGLDGSTVYHYRLLATNAAGTIDGPDQTFTTQTVGGELTLLDGRQWELVSPPNKHSAKIREISAEGMIQASENGHAISYATFFGATEADPEGASNISQIMSTRTAGGWSSKDIALPHAAPTGAAISFGGEYRFFSPDLSLSLVEQQGPFTPLSADATEDTEYVRRNGECETNPSTCYTALVTAANVPPGTKFGQGLLVGKARFVGATPDLTHVILHSDVALTTTPGDEGGLYEWAGGQLRLVSVLPESEGGTPEKHKTELGEANENARNAISEDGSRVFWNAPAGNGLYMRDLARGETLHIAPFRSRFQIANTDGSRVFFSTEIEGGALEECDIVEVAGKLACEVTQLAPDTQGAVLGISEDGSYVYFVSNAAMAPGAVAGACAPLAPPEDECNLYMAHRGAAGWESPKLIAVVSAEDEADWAGKGRILAHLTARVSPDGRRLAFMSQRNLAGYDSTDAVSGQSDEEVYLYDANSERLVCASCNPSGGRPTGTRYEFESRADILGGGDRVWREETWLAANIPGWTPYELDIARYQSRYLSDEGRLFFNSGDALVPQDVNGTWDVYEYEPPGVGNCSTASPTFSARSSGCVDLISSGESPEQSAFMDASSSGDDVFFLAADHLAAQDVDTALDIYDAHACSVSVPCASAPVSPPPCSTGDSCKSAPSPQPSVFGAPASATFAGIGNVTPSSKGAPAHRSLSRAQKLARALRACHRKKVKRRRVTCERHAHKRYRVKKATGGSR